MKILTSVTASNGLDVSSANVDKIVLGSSGSENNDVNVDNLTVWANAEFKNNVILGSSAADSIKLNSPVSSSNPITASYFVGDGSLLTNLPAGGGGVTASEVSGAITASITNISLKLINYINNGPVEEYSGAYLQISPTGTVFPTSSIWYTDSTKTKKIYEEFYDRSSSTVNPSPIVYKLYAADGVTVTIQATDTITYSSIGVTNISRSISSSYY